MALLKTVKYLIVGVTMHEDYKFFEDGYDSAGTYTLYVTYRCNWNCNYCSEDTWNRADVTDQDLLRKVESITPNSDVSITGGEPGLLPKPLMETVIQQLRDKDCEIHINTNGTFFKKFNYLCDSVDGFLYHCSEDLQEDIYIPTHVDQQKIQYMLVLTDRNYHRLDYYLDQYPSINFLIFGADNIIGNGLSRKNGFELSRKYRGRIHDESHIHLITKCRDVHQMRGLRALR